MSEDVHRSWVSDERADIRVFKSPTMADVKTGVIDVLRIAAEERGISFEAFCCDISAIRTWHYSRVECAFNRPSSSNRRPHDEGFRRLRLRFGRCAVNLRTERR